MSKQALNNRAMLVNTTVRRWWPVKVDKKASDEVAKVHNSDSSLGRYHKRLVSKSAMKELTEIRNEIRSTHYFLTLPWEDEGYRILSSDAYLKYQERMTKLKARYETAVRDFLPQYPQYVAEARRALNGLFNEDDYPANIVDKFGVDIKIKPMPAATDFRVEGMDPQSVDAIRAQIEAETQEIMTRAMANVWERLRTVVEHAVERLKAYTVTPEGKVENPFRDSLIQNITDLLEVIPVLNIAKDPELDRFADLIKRHVTAYDPETLRDSDTARESVAEKAQKILEKMKSFGL